MKIEELIYLELEGLTKTIREYTRDNFIISYSTKLCELTFPKDKKKMNILSSKLLDWYKVNIDDIKCNQYLPNIDSHLKSIKILEQLYELTL